MDVHDPYCLARGIPVNAAVGAADQEKALFAGDWRYLSQDSYLQMLPQRVRVVDGALAYCEVVVRAATFAVLHEVYTGQVVPVYDRSLMEWGMEPDLEIV